MTKTFERETEELKKRLLTIGTLVEEAVAGAVAAMSQRDAARATAVIQADREIDRLEVQFEEDCLTLLALHQPVAADLRFVITALKVNNDLERIGDLAKNIAKRVTHLTELPWSPLPEEYRQMATLVQSMVKESLDALVNRDVELARDVCRRDQEVDSLLSQVVRALPSQIAGDPESLETFLLLDGIGKQLERIGDMATNIGEDVVYLVAGDIVRHQLRAS